MWDSGLLDGAANNAADRAALQAVVPGGGAQLRFWRVAPTASIGAFQAVDRELRLDFCRQQGIVVVRRVSGGGAVYLDPDQLGFSLLLERDHGFHGAGLAQIYRRFGAALAAGLEALGIAAAFKAPNDLERDGRKLASFFAAAAGTRLLIHGSLLLDADIRSMLIALRVPTEKLSADGLAAARDRLMTVKECLGMLPDLAMVKQALAHAIAAELGLAPREAEAPAGAPQAQREEADHAHRIEWGSSEGWLEAVHKCEGGTLRARARFAADDARLDAVELAGDVHLTPPQAWARIAEAAQGGDGRRIAKRLDRALQGAQTLGFGSHELLGLLQLLLEKQRLRREIGLDLADASALMVVGADAAKPLAILDNASVMLVPYCAKPSWCKWRHEDGCTECGLCEVGDAYRMARERGMKVTSIVRYEHLVETLRQMREAGEPAYVGMCCSNFFIKRQRAFRDAGIPALLMDISGANCYELQQEDQAYAGRFEAKAELNARLLEQVMRFVPPRKGEES